MRLLTASPQKRLSIRQVSTAAESIAAAQFAMYGFDVLEQGNQARYFYNLAVANAQGMLKITVYGSFRGFWNLVDPYLYESAPHSAACHKAVDRWLERQGFRAMYCLVQFDSSDLTTMPRIYLASAAEIAARLHENVEMIGDTALYEQFEVQDGSGRHTVETLPAHWRLSQNRIAELMETEEGKLGFGFSESAVCAVCAAADSEATAQPVPMMH